MTAARLIHRLALAAVLIIAAHSVTLAQAPRNLVRNGDFSGGLREWRVTEGTSCAATIVDSTVEGYPKALHLDLNPDPDAEPWSVILNQPVAAFLEEGEPLILRAWMRSPDRCRASAYVEMGREPWTKSPSGTVELTPDWQEYEFSGPSLEDFSAAEAVLGFHLGFGRGAIEITGVRLLAPNMQPDRGGERPTMDKPESLITNGDFAQPLEGTWHTVGGERLRVEVVDAEVADYRRAVRLTCDPEPEAAVWNLQFGQTCRGYVHPGDALYLRAWLRSPDKCRVTFIYELGEPPHTKTISQVVRLTPEWQEYRFMGRATQGFRPGQSRMSWFLGHDKGVVEVAGVRVENHGDAPESAFDQTVDYWGGREHRDTWRGPALERIEQVRKGGLSVRVLDADGNPVPGAAVHVRQKRHHFRFGTALPAGRLVDTANPDNVRFQREVERLYNTVTFENDLKWAATSESRLATVEGATEWLRERGIEVRGHCLLWGSYRHLPAPARELRGAALLEACRAHVTDYVTRMRGRLYLWDVVNEAGSNTELWDEIGWENFANSFRWAKEADPDVLLCYNDYGIVADNPPYRAKVAERIRYLLEQGAPVDVLGIQAHMGVPLVPLQRVLEILDEWAGFGKPLEITEFDIGIWNDEAHAAYVRDFMTAVFSHPRVQSFIMWGFWEGSHWRAKDGGAMFRHDWTPRPAQTAWEDLVLKQWWTSWDGAADNQGLAALRAFYGKHEVTAEHEGKTASATVDLLPGGEGAVELRLK